jgi:endonuclease/exonuclease/phosphatase family metal-dependent hydrolase
MGKCNKKEQYIVDINNEIKLIEADYAFLAGDFNSSGTSSVHHYLTGQRTLLNTEANPIWEDLGEVHAQRTNSKLEYTVDLINNARWKGKNIPCSSERFDRIYIKGEFKKAPPILENFYLFGKKIDEDSGYCASDHFGVVAELRSR